MAFDTDISDKVVRTSLPMLQDALVKLMADAGWPDDISRQITVKYSAGLIGIDFPPSIREEVLSLEYGTYTVPPKPALRRFSAEKDRIISEQLMTDLPEILSSLIQREVK